MTTKLNKRERRAQQLLAHYTTCERLARYLRAANPDGKKISVALWKVEKLASDASVAYCNGESFGYYSRNCGHFVYNGGIIFDPLKWEVFIDSQIKPAVQKVLGKLPPGFFVNGDPRGYALKIDNENPEGRKLIEAVGLHTDFGGYGILSPEIDGN